MRHLAIAAHPPGESASLTLNDSIQRAIIYDCTILQTKLGEFLGTRVGLFSCARWPPLECYAQAYITSYATEEPEGRRVSGVLVDHALVGGLRHRYGQCNRLVELSSARLHRDNGRDRDPVAQKFRHELSRYRVSLELRISTN